MRHRRGFWITATLLGFGLCAAAQSDANAALPLTPSKKSAFPSVRASVPEKAAGQKLTPSQKFVVETVNMAVALPQPDPQDRLRVLSTAADVVSPIDRKQAKILWREGARIESELIRLGQHPAVSVMAGGNADCVAGQQFVENVPETSVVAAEQSLIGAVTSCRTRTLDIVARKLDAALQKRIVAPRALMAVMEAEGVNSTWSQTHFEQMFDSLPDPEENSAEAENIAAMYAHISGDVSKNAAKKSGLKLLDWLGQQDDKGLRTLAINIVAGAMQQALGEQAFQDALSSDVVAGSIARNAANAAPTRIERPPVVGTSVLQAMRDTGEDRSDVLRDLPAVQRARDAAAHGFASGTSKENQQASKYFDIAFAAVDEVWGARTPEENAAAVVEEVSEAAAQVDSVNALLRAEKLRDPSAQAIGMLAVARVVAGRGTAR